MGDYIFYFPGNGFGFATNNVSSGSDVYYSTTLNGVYQKVGEISYYTASSPSGGITYKNTYTTDKGAGYYKIVITKNATGLLYDFKYLSELPEVIVVENKGTATASNGTIVMNSTNDYSIINSTYDLKVTLYRGTGEVYKSSTANGTYSLVSPSNGTYNLTKGYYYKLVSKTLSENQTVFNVWASNLSEMPEGLSVVNFVQK